MRAILAALILCATLTPSAAHAAPSIDVPDGTYGQPVTATTSESKFVRAWCADTNGKVIYEQFVKPANGVAVFQLGPTNYWRSADQAAHCQGETGRLVGGRWTATAVDEFAVSG